MVKIARVPDIHPNRSGLFVNGIWPGTTEEEGELKEPRNMARQERTLETESCGLWPGTICWLDKAVGAYAKGRKSKVWVGSGRKRTTSTTEVSL